MKTVNAWLALLSAAGLTLAGNTEVAEAAGPVAPIEVAMLQADPPAPADPGATPAKPETPAPAPGETPPPPGETPKPAVPTNPRASAAAVVESAKAAGEAMPAAPTPAPAPAPAPAPGAEGQPMPGEEGTPETPSDGSPGGGTAADFRYPQTAVTSWLEALKAKDPERLAEATALRAPTEAKASRRNLFRAILDQSLPENDLNELARVMEGYQIYGANQAKSSGRLGVILQKTEGNNILRRTFETRREKMGWKVLDIGDQGKINSRPIRGRR